MREPFTFDPKIRYAILQSCDENILEHDTAVHRLGIRHRCSTSPATTSVCFRAQLFHRHVHLRRDLCVTATRNEHSRSHASDSICQIGNLCMCVDVCVSNVETARASPRRALIGRRRHQRGRLQRGLRVRRLGWRRVELPMWRVRAGLTLLCVSPASQILVILIISIPLPRIPIVIMVHSQATTSTIVALAWRIVNRTPRLKR